MTISRDAQNLSKDAWYYESLRSIRVIAWGENQNGFRYVTTCVIPHRMLRASIGRADAMRRKRKKP